MFQQDMYRLGTQRSCIRELFEYGLIQAQLVGAENVFDYSLGNPSIPAPKQVKEALLDIAANKPPLTVHGYTSAGGYSGARAAVAQDLSERFGVAAKPEEIFFVCGAAPGLVAVLKALILGKESEIIAIAPFFPEYRPFVEQNGGSLVVVPPDMEHFQIRLDALAQAITPNTQAVIVNSPNNPSGAVYTRETLTKAANLLQERAKAYGHPIYLISDEPYRELVYGDVEVPFIPTIYPDTVVCYSWSKSLSLPGERIGYVYIPQTATDGQALLAAVAGAARICGHVCPPSLIQRVVKRCIKVMPDLEAYNENRTLLYDSLTKMGYRMAQPDGAFYLFIEAPGGDSEAFSQRAKEKNLLVVPGTSFGCREYFRICYCVDKQMIERSLPVFKELIEKS